MDNKVRQCLMYINSNYKNKLLNAFIKQDIEDLVKRTDLEEETILAVRNVLKAEFSE